MKILEAHSDPSRKSQMELFASLVLRLKIINYFHIMLHLKCSTDSEYVSVFFFPGIFIQLQQNMLPKCSFSELLRSSFSRIWTKQYIQPQYGKMRTIRTPNKDTFYAVVVRNIYLRVINEKFDIHEDKKMTVKSHRTF